MTLGINLFSSYINIKVLSYILQINFDRFFPDMLELKMKTKHFEKKNKNKNHTIDFFCFLLDDLKFIS